jgi:L-ascorbate metabolism protein UlaG (beta-lactamase superfamily)
MLNMNATMITLPAIFVALQWAAVAAEAGFESDRIETSAGGLTITFIGHGTLMFEFAGKVIHVDPWTRLANYAKLPKADIILITHDHPDHLDAAAIQAVRSDKTAVIVSKSCTGEVSGAEVMKNGDVRTVSSIKIEAVPAYNVVHKRPDGGPFHPKGDGNGYILTFGDKRVYVAGDTENTPEMKALKNIDVAFLPMNLPYTMTPEMAADAAKAFRPRILYPYHTGDTDLSRLKDLVKDDKDIDLRFRKLN